MNAEHIPVCVLINSRLILISEILFQVLPPYDAWKCTTHFLAFCPVETCRSGRSQMENFTNPLLDAIKIHAMPIYFLLPVDCVSRLHTLLSTQ